jgi:hypothetical protein
VAFLIFARKNILFAVSCCLPIFQGKIMNKVLPILCLLIASCGSTTTNNYSDFTLPKDVLLQAKDDFRRSDDKILFLLMVNQTGDVVKVRVLDNKLQNKQFLNMFKKNMYNLKYPKADKSDPEFREFVLPFGVKTEVEFYG